MVGSRGLVMGLLVGMSATPAFADSEVGIGDVFNKAKGWLDKQLNGAESNEPTPSTPPPATAPTDKAASSSAPAPTDKAASPSTPAPKDKVASAPAASAVKEKDTSWTRYLLLQPAEDQAFLMEIVEGVYVGDTVLISNGLNLGIYFGRNLLSANVAFNYGSTEMASEASDSSHVRLTVDTDHNAIAYGIRFGREVWPFLFPYVGYARGHYASDISQKVEVREDSDSVSIPIASFDLKNFETSSLQIGCDARVHFWKVWTLAAGLGAEIPYSVSTLAFKKAEAYDDPVYAKAIADLESKMKSPMYQLSLRFGFAF